MTDREIREAIKNGARSLEAIGSACGAATGCGGCASEVAALLFRRNRMLPLVSALMSSDFEQAS